MAEGTGEAGRLGVFISYSRDDLEFADQLDAALKLYGFDTTIDRHGISGGEEWKRRLGNLIRDADTVIFVLSPASAVSPVCKWEVEEAVKLGKRIIPVVCRDLEGTHPPPQLADLNYIIFYSESETPGSGFGTGLARLVHALNTDLEWLREHTRLLQRATEWDTGGRPGNRLLSGGDIAAAKAWAARRPKDAPEPTELHLDFIKASESWEAAQQSEELRRMAERERLVREAEIAQLRVDTSRRVMQRTLVGLAVAVVLAVLSGAMGTYAFMQRQAAVEAGKTLLKARDELLLNQARFVTSAADEALKRNDPSTALLLALEVFRHREGDNVASLRSHLAPAAATLGLALQQYRERQILRGHTSTVYGVAVSPDGAQVVTGSSDKTARVWDAKTGKEKLPPLTGHTGLVWSVAMLPDGRIVTGAWGRGQVRIWDPNTGGELLQLQGHTADVNGIAVTDDGRILTASDDKTARVWDAKTGAERLLLTGHTDFVYGVVMAPDGRIVTGSKDGTARIWDSKSGAELLQLQGHTQSVRAVAVTPDGKHIITASEDKTARVWDARTGTEVAQLKGHTGAVNAVAVTPDGQHIITGSADGSIRLWEIETGAAQLQLRVHTDRVLGLALGPDGMLVTGAADGTARIWDMGPRTQALPIKGHTGDIYGIAVTGDGGRIATASVDKTARVWDAKTGAELVKLEGHADGVNAITFSPDAERVITASSDKTARVWDAKTGAELLRLEGHTAAVVKVAVSADGARIITGSMDGTARIWDAQTGAPLRKLDGHTDTVWAVLLDGARVITGADDGTARIWDAQTGTEVRRLDGHASGVVDIALIPDKHRLVTASNDGTARIWDTGTGEEIIRLSGHTGSVVGTVVTPDGGRIVTTGVDGTMRVWDAKSGDELVRLQSNVGNVYGLALTADGSRLVTGAGPTGVHVWEFPATGQGLIDTAMKVTARCLTPAQRKSAFLPVRPPEWCGKMEKWPYDSVSAFIEGLKLIAEGKDDEGETVLASVPRKDAAVAKRIDEARAAGYVERGNALLQRGSEGQAIEAFNKAAKHDPAAAKRVDEILVNSYIARGRDLAQDGRDEGAETAFAKALARDPGAAKRIDEAWVVVLLDRGKNRLEAGKDNEALAAFAKALARDPSVAKRIEHIEGDSYIFRGRKLVTSNKEEEAAAAFAKAMASDPEAGKRIDEAWVQGLVSRGSNLLNDANRDAKTADKLRGDALASFEQAVAKARRDGIAKNLLADAVHGRGRALDALKRYREAVADFKEASQLGNPNASNWLWWATDDAARDIADEGKVVHALLVTATNHLDLTPELKKSIGARALKSSTGVWARIASVHANLPRPVESLPITNCDRLAAYPYDPYRVAPGVAIDSVDSPAAVDACTEAVRQYPNEPRYLYQRSRAFTRAAGLAANDKSQADKNYAAAIEDLAGVMARGYPAAFNNMAFALQRGEGVQKDEDRAADLYLEALNRVIHCCWVPVARHLLEQESQHDVPTVRRVVHDLLLWADALGSEPAGKMLTELYANGVLVRPTDRPSLGKADFKSLPPWLR